MATNTSAQFQADLTRYLDHEVLRLAQRHLVLRQFADKIKLPEHMGTTYTATRYNRVPLPFAPLSEGVAPTGETISISQVTGVALQWGDKITITDVANLTIEHPIIEQATRLLGYQVPETYERNLWLQLLSGTQVNFVNSRGSRAAIVAGDNLDPTTVNRTVVNLKNLGAPMMNGPTETDVRRDISSGPKRASASPMSHEHYLSVGSPMVIDGDFASNPTVVTAWSYSDLDKLYINETGQWRGMYFITSNLTPNWVGIANNAAGLTYTPGTAGTLPANTNTFIQVTGSDTQNQYESQIYQVSGAQNVGGSNTGSVSVVTPSTTGYTYSIYISQGAGTSPSNLGVTTSGPTTGPYAGQAVQLPPATTVVITAIGQMQVPPAAPQTGVTVWPTLVLGEDAFACLELEKLTWTRLFEADKSDPLNQLRVVGWKGWDGTVIKNNNFFCRIESTASFTGAFG